jgi:hypothetical protein
MGTHQSGAITAEQAMFELTLRNAEQSRQTFDDVVVEGLLGGLPVELLTRLEALWAETRVIAGEIVAIGRIVISEIIAFFKSNPRLTVGIALGAAVGLLIGAIPFIGPLLAPIAMVLGPIYGAGIGATAQRGSASASPLAGAMALARNFFELFVAILNAVSKYWEAE